MTSTENLASLGQRPATGDPPSPIRAVHVGTDLWGPDPTAASPFRPTRTELPRRVRSLIRALADAGDPQSVVTSLRRRRSAGPSGTGVRVLTVPTRRPDDLPPVRALPVVLGLASSIDVLHLHLGRAGLLASATAMVRTARVPVVAHLHASVAHPLRTGERASVTTRLLHAALEDHVLSSADIVVVPGQRLAEVASESGAARIEVVPPAALPVGTPAPAAPPAMAAARHRIVSVGPLTARRRPESLVRALAWQPPDTHLFLLGDGPHRVDVDREVRRQHLDGRVHVVPTLTWQVVTDHLAHAHVAASAALSGDDATVPLLAAALGRAVVATAIEGIPDIMSDGIDGRLVPPDDEDALAGALREVLTTPKHAADLEASARRRRSTGAWTAHADRIRVLVRSLDRSTTSRHRGASSARNASA